MQRWNLREIETPEGSRSPVVLHSEDGVARAVLEDARPRRRLDLADRAAFCITRFELCRLRRPRRSVRASLRLRRERLGIDVDLAALLVDPDFLVVVATEL